MASDTLQINIGLFGGFPAPAGLCNDELAAAMWHRLHRVYLWAAERFGPSVQRRLVCPADPSEEPTVIVACGFHERLCKSQLVFDLWALCEELDQDCVAVYYCDQGILIGPNAAAWGAFDESSFHFIDKA